MHAYQQMGLKGDIRAALLLCILLKVTTYEIDEIKKKRGTSRNIIKLKHMHYCYF